MIGGDREALKDLERILVGRGPMYSKADATLDTSGVPVDQSFAGLLELVSA
jgi:hypothetical protein